MDLFTACELAKDILSDLEAGCERIAITGSLRLSRSYVNEIELIVIPIINFYEEAYFRRDEYTGKIEKKINLFDKFLGLYLSDSAWKWRRKEKRKNYIRLSSIDHNLDCIISFAKLGSWGGAMVINTGPPSFSMAIMNLIQKRSFYLDANFFLHKHPKPEKNRKSRERCHAIVACPNEEIFFKQLGLPYIELKDRLKESILEKINEARPYYGSRIC